jgi:hypothetical protein
LEQKKMNSKICITNRKQMAEHGHCKRQERKIVVYSVSAHESVVVIVYQLPVLQREEIRNMIEPLLPLRTLTLQLQVQQHCLLLISHFR